MLVIATILLGAVAQSVAGFGFALISGPVLIATLGPQAGVQLLILLSSVISAGLLLHEGRHARVGVGLVLLVPGVLMTPVAAWVVQRLDARALTGTAGLATLLSVALLASGRRLPWLQGWRGATGASLLSAVMNVLGGLSGPAVALYAVNAAWPAHTVRPTLQVYGLGLTLVALATLGIPALTPAPLLAAAAGWITGSLIARHLSPPITRRIILTVAAIGGISVLLRVV